VLLSAVIGGRARAILQHHAIEEIVVAEPAFQEIREYAPYLARKKGLVIDRVLLAVATLPVRIVAREEYEPAVARAAKRIGKRDPDDIDTLALELHLAGPVWSNDNDFDDAGVEWYTTAELIERLRCRE
jgi:predicted nucleic acid-binding protein